MCTFCGAYKGVRFRFKDEKVIDADLDFAARYCRRQKRVFLTDGDPLSLSQRRLVGLLEGVRARLPWVNRISTYASARSLRARSVEELAVLRDLGLSRIYMGLESGDDLTLSAIRKGVDAKAMIQAGRKARAAGLFLSVTVLLGVAGEGRSYAHAAETAKVLNEMAPNQIAALTLMVLPNTPLHQDERAGRFRLPSREHLLTELKTIVDHIYLDRVQFQANHASNYLSIGGRLPRDRDAILATIEEAIGGHVPLTPEHMRRL